MKQNNKPIRPMLSVALSESHKAHFKRAAKAQGLTLSGWVVNTLNQAAYSILGQFNITDDCIDNINTKSQEGKKS
jgi:uncharacterized protein (DUF1778 family)